MKRVINKLVVAGALIAAAVIGAPAWADEEQDLRRALDVLTRQDGSGVGLSIGDRGRLEDLSERLRLRLEIEGRLAEIDRLKGGVKKDAPIQQPITQVVATTSAVVPPTEGFAVARISGRDGVYEAIVVDAGGRWSAVKEGGELGKGVKVEAITFAAVKVREGDKVRVLPFAGVSGVSVPRSPN